MAKESKDVIAIKKLASDWSAGWNQGETEALLSLFTDNPVLMPQGQPIVTGKNAIGSLYEALFREFTVKGKGKIMDVDASGDLGYFWSTYAITATPKSGGKQTRSIGKSIFIVQRQTDSTWKIARLMDNSDTE